jgi:serine/threonine protein kinase
VTDKTFSQNCPRCGAPGNRHVAGGLCPACLLKQVALGTGAESLPAEPWMAPAPSELAPAFPQLEIIELVGRGGMGAVYKARQKSLGRYVALKILSPQRATDPSFAERFAREARALAELNHTSIVTVHDFGRAGQFYFLLMEFVDGVNLRQAMRAGRFTPEQALAIVPSICGALQFAHDHGIVHCDIKPENLLLDKSGRVKVADFGIARMLGAGRDSDSGAAPCPMQESVLGTPHYMAPEQAARPAQVNHRADIYSLGVVLYELLTGELPVGEFEPPSRKVQIDVRLDAIVLRALEQTPELRYQTIGEMRTQVETVINEPGPAFLAGSHAGISAPRHIRMGQSYVTTPEELATFDGQFSLYRRKNQMNLDESQLIFARARTITAIPLAAIRDLSIGRYPRAMNPVGIDFISVTYDERGQARRLLFTPFQGVFGLPSQFNQYVAEWFDEIRDAAVAITGQAPGNTPANRLGTPSSSLELCVLMLSPLLLTVVLVGSGVLVLWGLSLTWALAVVGLVVTCDLCLLGWVLRTMVNHGRSLKIPGKPSNSGWEE